MLKQMIGDAEWSFINGVYQLPVDDTTARKARVCSPRSPATSSAPGVEMVWAWHEGIEQPAKFPAAALPVWEAKGWVPGPPPEPVSPFNGDQLPVNAVKPLTTPAEAPAEPTKAAAGRSCMRSSTCGQPVGLRGEAIAACGYRHRSLTLQGTPGQGFGGYAQASRSGSAVRPGAVTRGRSGRLDNWRPCSPD
jgi:hypothetical protein